MRAFILIAALATAIVYTAHAMPGSGLATHRVFDDVVDSVTYVSHPSHHHDKNHRGKKGGKGEEMTLGQAVRGLIHLTAREEQDKSIARWEKKTKRRSMLNGGRSIKNAEYGSGNAPAGAVASVANTQAIPSPSQTVESLAIPIPRRLPTAQDLFKLHTPDT